MIILVMADLEMLVLDKTKPEDYEHEFIERVITLTESYEDWSRENNAKWLLSDDLYDLLWEAYPWNSPIHQRTDLCTLFSLWIERADKKIVVSESLDLKLSPDIHAAYASRDYPKLDKEWRKVLARNVDIPHNHTLIFSFGKKPNKIELIDLDSDYRQIFLLIKSRQDWQSALMQTDLWLIHGLPKSGEYPYIPPKSYREEDSDFPREFCQHRNTSGFKDKKGWIWIFHKEENHWDVQCGKDNYCKVSPDGKLC
jgi:hypothetical protein